MANSLLLILFNLRTIGKIKQKMIITLNILSPNNTCLLFRYTSNLNLKKSKILTWLVMVVKNIVLIPLVSTK